MGANASQLEKEIGPHEFPQNEHYFGLVNFGNTCYCNSVLQALFFCRPFRERVLGYKPISKRKESLLTCLADLFANIASQKKKVGVLAPKKFVARLRKENELFDNYMQQDAHEFLNYLLNTIADLLQGERAKEKEKEKHSSTSSVSSKSSASSAGTINGGSSIQNGKMEPTWVHDIFEGILTNETRCLCCETVSCNLRICCRLNLISGQNNSFKDIMNPGERAKEKEKEKHSSTSSVSSKSSASSAGTINGGSSIQNGKMEPTWVHDIFEGILTNETRCLCCETVSCNLRICCRLNLISGQNSDDAINHGKLYDLVAVVIHCGSGPNRGHYITIVKSHGLWLLFDDDIVEKIEAQAIEEFYGLTSEIQKASESGYILFYEARG
ncbi:PREDICTED: ubiquitin carboxyl-terminal hydrolase 46-like [Acropora digitifera]|uniref:ubiquitin carboxyl-terminal hydrolase 46-like n=1 Tax=Acropora digitifera TaxID=70779 RepID=UPI00077AAAD4|nr:PREDICTED: ubiquitin carboxyl-terminal hydrolase 46-like [Acropora digitifera]